MLFDHAESLAQLFLEHLKKKSKTSVSKKIECGQELHCQKTTSKVPKHDFWYFQSDQSLERHIDGNI